MASGWRSIAGSAAMLRLRLLADMERLPTCCDELEAAGRSCGAVRLVRPRIDTADLVNTAA